MTTRTQREINQGGSRTPGVKEVRRSCTEAMAMFDALPREHRLLLMDLPANMNLTAAVSSVELIESVLTARFTESCLNTYGPDHPQAHIPITPLRRQKVY